MGGAEGKGRWRWQGMMGGARWGRRQDGEGNAPNNARGGERGKGKTTAMVMARAKARADGERARG